MLFSNFGSEEASIIKSVMDELSQVKKDAKEANHREDIFVSLIAYDLRPPLAGVINALDILKDDFEDESKSQQKEVLKIAQNSCELMIRMIDKFLDLSKLNGGKVQFSKIFCDLHSLVGLVIDIHSCSAGKKGIKIINNIPEGVKAHVDFNLFFEVIQNLVSNAIKFCKEGDTITLYMPEGNDITIAVSDTGAGISENAMSKLFLENEKTSTVGTAGERGTGLGLLFCHKIMKMHGGSLTIESEVGIGSTFFATLPFINPALLILDD